MGQIRLVQGAGQGVSVGELKNSLIRVKKDRFHWTVGIKGFHKGDGRSMADRQESQKSYDCSRWRKAFDPCILDASLPGSQNGEHEDKTTRKLREAAPR